MEELETLFAAQWDNGLVPSIVFNAEYWNSTYYFPGAGTNCLANTPDWWQSYVSPVANKIYNTSGIVDPP